jgi:RNA polymerase sigma-70 factor (ECF subfamily)
VRKTPEKGVGVPDPDDGFAELWDAHYDDVLSYAARRVDHETARDVAAETFLIAWRRRDDIPADRPFPWLLNVAWNVLANEARGHRRRGGRGCGRPGRCLWGSTGGAGRRGYPLT